MVSYLLGGKKRYGKVEKSEGGSCMEGSKAWESVEPGAGGLAGLWPSSPMDTQRGKGNHRTTSLPDRTAASSVQARSRHRDDTGSVRSRTHMDFDQGVSGSRNQTSGNAWVISPVTVHCGVRLETDWSFSFGYRRAYTWMMGTKETETTSFI